MGVEQRLLERLSRVPWSQFSFIVADKMAVKPSIGPWQAGILCPDEESECQDAKWIWRHPDFLKSE
jgi:hypothetical protein